MRVLSYNIHKGFSSGNLAYTLEEIRHAIRATEADIVCLQEVVGENRRHAVALERWVDTQFEFLADQVWDYRVYGKNAVYDHGHHGNAILSKVPLLRHSNHDVIVLPFSQRGILHAVTEAGVHVLCAHLGLLSWERRRQMDALLRLFRQIPAAEPLVLAGDFNDWRAESHARLLASGLQEAMQQGTGAVQKTFPAWWPLLRMDCIYCRNLQLVEARRLDGAGWRGISDHTPLYAAFEPNSV